MLDEPESTVHKVPVDSLSPADSPRLEGLSRDHVQVLAESGTEFEPILVHRPTGRVVDGMHRLQAAILRGQRVIAVRYVEGSPVDLFVQSVKANTSHGLPLTLKDRKAAVARILASHPHWSDRAIAAVAGVSPKTVGAARAKRSSREAPDPSHSGRATVRVGRDGRARPVDIPQRREKVLALLEERSDVTLREVAEKAGVSISTVHRMRQGLRSCRAEQDPEPRAGTAAPQRADPTTTPDATATPFQGTRLTPVPDPQKRFSSSTRTRVRAMHTLSNDPSVRLTDSGRTLLRWLNGQAQGLAAVERMLDVVPPHCVRAVAEVASHYAKEWERLASTLRQIDRLNGPWQAAR